MKTVKMNKIKGPIRLNLTNYNRGNKYMTSKTLSDSLLFGKKRSLSINVGIKYKRRLPQLIKPIYSQGNKYQNLKYLSLACYPLRALDCLLNISV